MLHFDGTPASAAALAKQFGFYPGDCPEIIDHGATRRRRPRVAFVGASELREMSRSITGMSSEERRLKEMREDREERHRRSVAMVKNWENTIAGQRRIKLQARQRRLEAEEAERVRQDAEWAAEEAERRRVSIARARQLQFFERDSVREFHSRVLLNQVLREQDRQLAYKAEVRNAERESDQAFLRARDEKMRKKAQEEEEQREVEKKRRTEVARDQMLQVLAKREEEIKQIQREVEEGKFIRALDEEHAKMQEDLVAERRQSKVVLQLELLEMVKKSKEEKDSRRKTAEAEDEKRSAWVKRKEKQARMKQLLQNQWFSEAQKTAKRLGEHQAQMIREARKVEEEKVERRAKDAEKRAQEREEREEAERKKRIADIKESYEAARIQKELAQKAERDEEQRWKEQYPREAEEEKHQQEEKRKAALAHNKKVQECLLRQMEQARQNRKEERAARFSDEWRARFAAEDQEMDDYARSLLLEPWAQDPTRPLAKLYPSEIRMRLGLGQPVKSNSAENKHPQRGTRVVLARPPCGVNVT